MKIQEIEFNVRTVRKNPQLGTAKPTVIRILRFNSMVALRSPFSTSIADHVTQEVDLSSSYKIGWIALLF